MINFIRKICKLGQSWITDCVLIYPPITVTFLNMWWVITKSSSYIVFKYIIVFRWLPYFLLIPERLLAWKKFTLPLITSTHICKELEQNMQLQVTQFSIKKHQHIYDSSPTDNITIADFQLVTATMCLEAINFDFSSYKAVSKWYDTYKKEYPDLWAIVEGGMKEIAEFEKNPPDLSHMDHPIHPVRKNWKGTISKCFVVSLNFCIFFNKINITSRLLFVAR